VPQHHQHVPIILNLVSVVGAIFLIGGLIDLHFWATLLGAIVVYLGKLWFIDRMVWLYQDMKDANPEYGSWLH
jgi:hypothetical protein